MPRGPHVRTSSWPSPLLLPIEPRLELSVSGRFRRASASICSSRRITWRSAEPRSEASARQSTDTPSVTLRAASISGSFGGPVIALSNGAAAKTEQGRPWQLVGPVHLAREADEGAGHAHPRGVSRGFPERLGHLRVRQAQLDPRDDRLAFLGGEPPERGLILLERLLPDRRLDRRRVLSRQRRVELG